jgi:hypothetical protein
MTAPNNTTLPNNFYTANSGTTTSNPFITYYSERDPTQYDVNFPIQKRWVNFSTTPPKEWILESNTNVTGFTLSTWVLLTGAGAGPVYDFIVPLGTSPVHADAFGNFNFTSSGGTVAITGSLNTINLDITGGTDAVERLQTDDGLFETPTGTPGTIGLAGGANITTSQLTAHSAQIAVSGTTNHAVQLGNASGSLTSLALVNDGVLITGNTGIPSWLANGTIYQVLTATPSSPPSWQIPALVFIQSQTAATSANIAFTTNTNLFRTYLIIWETVIPATATANLIIQVSLNGGSSWVTSGYTAGFNYTAYNSATLNNENSTSNFPVSGPSTTNSIGMHGMAYLINCNNAQACSINGDCSYFDSTLMAASFGSSGGYSGQSGVNAFNILFSSGNITSGNFKLYGVTG